MTDYTQDFIDSINYEEFVSMFSVFNTQKSARKRGFEAHHIIPKHIQKINNQVDDRCIRLTPFEHILAHYILAREYKGEYIKIFCLMVSYNLNKIDNIDLIKLENLKDWAELRKSSIRRLSESRKGQIPSNKGKKARQDTIDKLRESHTGLKWWNNGTTQTMSKDKPGEDWALGRLKCTEKARKQMSLSHIGKRNGPHSEETKRKIGESNKKPRCIHWWTNGVDNVSSDVCPNGYYKGRYISDSQKDKLSKSHIGKKHSKETNDKRTNSLKDFYKHNSHHSCEKAVDIITMNVYNSIKDGLDDLGFSKSGWQKGHKNKKSKFYRLQKLEDYNNGLT